MILATSEGWGLTPPQREVLDCVLRGLSDTMEIARELDMTEGAVKVHLAALFAQVGARSRLELACRARRWGLASFQCSEG